MSTFSPRRATAVFAVLLMCFGMLIGRVIFLQTYGRQRTIRQAERQQHQIESIEARRGSVFDANGLEFVCSIQTKALFVDPKFMTEVFSQQGRSLTEMDDAVAKLAKLIDKDPFELSQLLSDRGRSRFLKVKEGIDEDTCKQ